MIGALFRFRILKKKSSTVQYKKKLFCKGINHHKIRKKLYLFKDKYAILIRYFHVTIFHSFSIIRKMFMAKIKEKTRSQEKFYAIVKIIITFKSDF